MLFLKRTALLFLLCLTAAVANAQQKKPAPAVFTRFSPSIDVSESVFSNTIVIGKGQTTSLNFGSDFIFSGVVTSNEQVFDNLQTVIIRSSQYNNALLQLSRLINEDKSISWAGRIFSQGSTDGYEIKKYADGSYHLKKFETAMILQDCDLHL
jgi:hypothetical protein